MKNNIKTKMNKITCITATNFNNFFLGKMRLIGFLFLLTINKNFAQNIFSGEPVQVVGQMNGYSTAASSNSSYRRVSVGSGTPTDGRGQWVKTYNVQSSGGDFTPRNMTGGGGSGFIFITGPSSNRFQNKWAFSGVGAASVNAVNGISAFNSGNDMGLNMNTAGRYTFVFNDVGYTQTNAKFYVAYTANAPVTVTRSSQTLNFDRSANLGITTSATPSSGENIYVRYTTSSDFTTSTTVVQATGSGTSWTATIPSQTIASTVRYYVFGSTISLASLNGMSEIDKSLSVINYDDNSSSNYSYTLTSSYTSSQTGNFNTSSTWGGNQLFDGASYTIANTHTVTLNENATISGITVNSGGTFVASDATPRTLTIASGGAITNNGTFTSGTGTVAFAGSGTVSGTVGFNNVTIAGGVNFGSASNIVTSLQINSGAFVNTNAPTYGSGSTLIYNTTGTYGRNLEWSATSGKGYPFHVQVQNGTTVDLAANGFADRAIAGNLNLGLNGAASAGSLSMGATTNKLSIGGNLIIGGNTSGTSVLTLSSAIGGDVYVTGNWDTKTNGSYASNTRAVFFEGTGTSSVTTIGAATFDYLFVNKASGGTVSLANDMTVNNNLTLNAQLVTNAFKVIIPTGNNVTANPNGWVRGNLQKNIPTGTNSRTFEVGDATVYAPVTTAYTGVTSAGNITVTTTDNDHPQIATSTISATKSVNRFYTITNSGVTGGSYDGTFTFVSGDVDGGATTGSFVVNNYVNPTWSAVTTGVTTSTTTQATGLTVYGDFQLGEPSFVTTTWTAGASTTAWTTAGNWSNGVPTAADSAIIATASFYPEITTTATVNMLTLDSGTSLTVVSGNNLTVVDVIDNDGTITVESDANLKQDNNVTNTGSGSTVVERTTSSLMRQDYVLWSSPVSGQQLQAFSPATLSTRFYEYDSSGDVYSSVTPTVNFDLAKGYLIRLPNTHPVSPTAWTGVFTGGHAHNGDVPLTGLTSGDYYAIGNPYPSAISADDFIINNSIGEALYFWRKTNNAANSSYATYTTAGGTSNSGGGSSLLPDGVIQVGQGFIAKAPASSMTIDNTMRILDNSAPFFRLNNNRSRIWLNLLNTAGYFGQAMVAYMPNATHGIDAAIDGRYINDYQTALTSIIDGGEFTIQGRSLPFDAADVVPLGFKTTTAGQFTIALDHADGLFADGTEAIYLRDLLTGTEQNLRTTAYTFTTETGIFNNRFELAYSSLLSVNPINFNVNQVVLYKQGNEVVIDAGMTKISNVEVFDLRGRLLLEISDIDATAFRFATDVAEQVLLVRITTTNGQTITKKLMN